MWHRVIAVFAPWMARQNALAGKHAATHGTEPLDGLDGILGAGRRIATSTTEERAYSVTIKADGKDQQLSHRRVALCQKFCNRVLI